MRERDYKRFPTLSRWMKHEDKRRKLVRFFDKELGIEGNWLRDDQMGLELRVELYIDHLLTVRGWDPDKAHKEHLRLANYIDQFADDYVEPEEEE